MTLSVCTNTRRNGLKTTNFEATVVALEMPDRHGLRANINLGFDAGFVLRLSIAVLALDSIPPRR